MLLLIVVSSISIVGKLLLVVHLIVGMLLLIVVSSISIVGKIVVSCTSNSRNIVVNCS